MNDKDKQKLTLWYDSFCYMNKIDSDLFDFEHEIDSSLSFDENVTILEDKLNALKSDGFFNQAMKEKAMAQIEEAATHEEFTAKTQDIFSKPQIIGICGNVNTGKSMLIYHLITQLKQKYNFSLYSYGLHLNMGDTKIYTIEEMENITNSIIFIDEFCSLFDLDDRKKRKEIEKTLRLIAHNNNIIILSGLPENFKKFISAKLSALYILKSTLSDLINGSRVKNLITSYSGIELGSSILNIKRGNVLLWDGLHYFTQPVPYYSQYDTKKDNKPIFLKKCTPKSEKSVPNNVQKENVKIKNVGICKTVEVINKNEL